jgi:hypothetical protein
MTRHLVSHTIFEIVEAAARVIKVVRRIIELPKPLTDDRDQAPPRLGILAMSAFHPLPRTSLVAAQFPEHRTAQVLPDDPISLPSRRVLIVEGDHFLLVRVIGPRRECVLVMVDGRAWKRESTVIIGTPLPRALSDSVEGMAWSLSVHERPAVQRETDDELVPWDSLCVEPVYGGCSIDRSSEDICLVVCDRVPGTSIVIGLRNIRGRTTFAIQSMPSGSKT